MVTKYHFSHNFKYEIFFFGFQNCKKRDALSDWKNFWNSWLSVPGDFSELIFLLRNLQEKFKKKYFLCMWVLREKKSRSKLYIFRKLDMTSEKLWPCCDVHLLSLYYLCPLSCMYCYASSEITNNLHSFNHLTSH